MNTEFFKAHTFGLPRWVWISLLVGGVGVGLYLRKHESEPEPTENSEEGYVNSGSLMPPGAPIGLEGSYGGSGGGGGVVGIPVNKPPETIEELPKTEPEPVELPESNPPPEPVIGEPHKEPKPPRGGRPPVHAPPIPAPGSGGEAVGPGHPAPGPPPPGVGPGHPVEEHSPEKEKALAEISRLNAEIGGLQNHIAQLTSVIQQYPNAQKRGQWEAERNQDRANIEHKREEIQNWQRKL